MDRHRTGAGSSPLSKSPGMPRNQCCRQQRLCDSSIVVAQAFIIRSAIVANRGRNYSGIHQRRRQPQRNPPCPRVSGAGQARAGGGARSKNRKSCLGPAAGAVTSCERNPKTCISGPCIGHRSRPISCASLFYSSPSRTCPFESISAGNDRGHRRRNCAGSVDRNARAAP
jgi:hypothetical protein